MKFFFRTIIAHELGRINPLAYLDKKQFSRDAFKEGSKIPNYDEWIKRHQKLLDGSWEKSIKHHVDHGKPIPIWVAAEVWDFGALSKFYSMLSGNNKDLICKRAGINSHSVLNNWLINLNGIRNRCAHHARLCNRPNIRVLSSLPQNDYFERLNLSELEKRKLYGLITVIWFLLKKIGVNSKWLFRIADIIDNKPNVPGFTYRSMGIDGNSFPKDLFC